VVSGPSAAIFEEGWSSEEELLFLSGIEQCGFGNWRDLSSVLGRLPRERRPEDCEAHWLEIYGRTACAPRPLLVTRGPTIPDPPPLFPTAPVKSKPTAEDLTNSAENKYGYMALRGEFEDEYCNDAEKILDGVVPADDDTRAFEKAVDLVELYNRMLSERRLRMKVVGQWGLRSGPPALSRILGGRTNEEKRLDQQIVTFAPYLEHDRTVDLAKGLHKVDESIVKYEGRCEWERHGITDHDQGFLFSNLRRLMERMKAEEPVKEDNMNAWNLAIKEYETHRTERPADGLEMLTEKEMEVVDVNKIAPALFFALKDLIIREFTARGGLSREEAVELAPDYRDKIEVMYDLFVEVRWIHG
jgi:hypothetical protein